MQQQALAATVAWVRLGRAMDAFEAELRRDFGVTALQHAVLSVCAERPQVTLAALRKALVVHAATLGQSIDDLRRRDLVTVRTDPRDRRARLVALTGAGAALVGRMPCAGPVRLRRIEADPVRLARLAQALEDALDLFGLDDTAGGPVA